MGVKQHEDRASASASASASAPAPSFGSPHTAFRPGIVIVIGVLTTMFSLTFLLLLYTKQCRRGGGYEEERARSGLGTSSGDRRSSGVDRAVVESLPLFRFGSLVGNKEGLECAVCLSPFTPSEALRLLPKCRHAFHVECVDVWLDAHSTCPLCRVRVDPEDVLLVPHPDSASITGDAPVEKPRMSAMAEALGRRISGRHSWAGEKSGFTSQLLQIVIHRPDPDTAEPPPPPPRNRIRRSADSLPLRSIELARRKDGLLLPEVRERLEHRIVLYDREPSGSERWSDLRPSDLLFLRSEMIITDSGRFSASRVPQTTANAGGGRGIVRERSVSEITTVSRFRRSSLPRQRAEEEEERTMRRWLTFAAKRTVRWLRSRSASNVPTEI